MAKTRSWSIKVEPMGAPRMTRSDRWKKRPVVLRYHTFRDTLRAAVGPIETPPDHIACNFWLSMPPSWSAKKRSAMSGKPHRQKPDVDNCLKGALDALFEEDSAIWSGTQAKFWGNKGVIEITMTWNN